MPDAPRRSGLAAQRDSGAPRPATTGALAQLAQNLGRRFAGPVAAALLGAAGLPGVAGAQVVQAAPVTPLEQVVTANPRIATPSQSLDLALLQRASLRSTANRLRTDLARMGWVVDRSEIDRAHARLAFEAKPPERVQLQEQLTIGEVVDRVDQLVQEDAALPPALLADLDRVLQDIRALKPGQRSTLRLPSGTVDVELPTAPRAPRVGALDPVEASIAAQRLNGPGASLLESLWSHGNSEFSLEAQTILSTYTAVANGLGEQAGRLPDLSFRVPVPLAYADQGLQFFVPPGASLAVQNGQFSLTAPGLMFTDGDGLAVVASQATVHLGEDLDGLSSSRVLFTDGERGGLLEGFTAGVARVDGAAVLAADRAVLDLSAGRAQLDGAQLRLGSDGALTLDAARAGLVGKGRQFAVLGLSARNQDGRSDLSVAQGLYTEADKQIATQNLSLHLEDGQAVLHAETLAITNGDLQLGGRSVALTAERQADGGHQLRLSGQDLRWVNAGASAFGAGPVEGRFTLDADGQLRAAHLSGAQLRFTEGERSGLAEGGSLDATLDASGRLQGLDASAASVQWQDGAQSARIDEGGLKLAFTDGGLRSLDANATRIALQSSEGRFGGEGGQLKARWDANGLARLDGKLDAGTWTGADGAEARLTQGRAELSFDGGRLERARLGLGQLDLVQADGRHLQLDGAEAEATLDGGILRTLRMQTGAASYREPDRSFTLSGMRFAAELDPRGRLQTASAQAADLELHDTQGRWMAAGALQLNARFDEDQLGQLQVNGRDLGFVDPNGRLGSLQASEGALNASFDGDGQLAALRLETVDAQLDGEFGRLQLGGRSVLSPRFEAGQLSGLEASAEHLVLLDGEREVDVRDARAALTIDGGELRSAQIQLASGHFAGAFGRADLSGTELRLERASAGGMHASGALSQLDLARDGGHLQIDEGRFEAVAQADGQLSSVQVEMQRARYTGTAEGKRDFAVDITGPRLQLQQTEQGGQTLGFDAHGGQFSVDGHDVRLEGTQSLRLETTPDGLVDTFSADFDGRIEWRESARGLEVQVADLGLDYDARASRLALDFSSADVAVRSEGLSARIEGAHAALDERRFSVQLDAAELQRDLGDHLGLSVEDFELELLRTEDGALDAASVSVGTLGLQTDKLSVTGSTRTGDRIRLDVDAEQGTLRELALRIPEGGALRVEREDLQVDLGPQRLRFAQPEDGRYVLEADGLDIQARTRDAEVKIEGGHAEVSLDAHTGALVLEDITGVGVQLKTGDLDVEIDLQQVRGFMAEAVGYEGGATGGALHLVPTEDGSRLSATVSGEVAGLPVELRFQDVHQLAAVAQVSVNQVHVFVGDASGQGETHIGVGPLKLQGSAIEVIGRYHAYDPGRMLSAVDALSTTHGERLFSGIRYEPDGVLRLGTDRDGLNAELAVVLPRWDAVPGYRMRLTDQPASALGGVLSIGYRAESHALAAFAGALPGSHATMFTRQGEVEVGGVELPRRLDLPTTAVAGLRFELPDVNDGGRLGATLGAYANPAGFADSPWLKEDKPYGGFVGLEYSKGDFSVGGGAVIDVDKSGDLDVGSVGLRVGFRF